MVVVSHEMGFAGMPPTGWSSWTRALIVEEGRRARSSPTRSTSARAPSSARSSGTERGMTGWERFTDTLLQRAASWRSTCPRSSRASWLTVVLALAIIATGLVLGLLLALLRAFGIRPLNWLIIFVVDLFRALPPLVIIVLMYLRAALGGDGALRLRRHLAGAVDGADGVLRGDLLGRHHLGRARGQWEAARSTGLTFVQTLRHVVLPQALRLTIPPLTNRTIAITKGTALGSVVAVQEILGAASGGGVALLQPLAADDGRHRLPGAVLSRGRARPLDRDALRVEEIGDG